MLERRLKVMHYSKCIGTAAALNESLVYRNASVCVCSSSVCLTCCIYIYIYSAGICLLDVGMYVYIVIQEIYRQQVGFGLSHRDDIKLCTTALGIHVPFILFFLIGRQLTLLNSEWKPKLSIIERETLIKRIKIEFVIQNVDFIIYCIDDGLMKKKNLLLLKI